MEEDEKTLWQDDDILVVNKPAGLLPIPDGYNAGLLCLSAAFTLIYGDLWVVHRLDRDTGGVFVLVRNEPAHREICQQFDRRRVAKM